ncbi:hypothetical protein RB614_36300 [Phytohabitans sp. ZYX-F-186]|uniref:MFS transporter n=1 Tax=Phytohabitans maris TaxID=3071409 RepID=A0ABU0ZSG6_9ACTN|nr:hypothetical protein [Phytohabitans sp. ZYX-F-186]MDQ7909974.1 hypothetical protein [Phytohabitans sp. ZYX-F-186]
MNRAGGLALTVASAFSSFPSPYYHRVAEASGSRWTTVGLFVAHSAASVTAIGALTRPRLARYTSARWLLPALLLADAAGGLLLVVAPTPGGAGWLLVGRVVTGAALGVLTAVVTSRLAARRRGPARATAAIFGGVGCGAVLAGTLAAVGLPRPAVFGLGAAALLAAAIAAPREAGTVVSSRPARARIAAAPALLAFSANGVLGLFTSTLPGLVAQRAGGAELVAGLTAGAVMLSAGLARLVLTRMPVAVPAVAGALTFGLGLPSGSAGPLLAGGVLLGLAAGLAYDRALLLVRRSGAGLAPVARAQWWGQVGLILPVVAYPLVVPP